MAWFHAVFSFLNFHDGIETCIISYKKRITSSGSMQDTGCLGLTKMTQRDGMGREVGVGFRIGNTGIPMADSCWCMAKPIQYCKVKQKKKHVSENLKEKVMKSEMASCSSILAWKIPWTGCQKFLWCIKFFISTLN